MARIAEDELQRIKSEISLERLVRARGIELRKHGAISSASVPSTTITIRRSWSRRRRTSGIVSALVRRVARSSTGR